MTPAPAVPKASISVRTLLAAYASGIFPMADSRHDDDIFWVEPRRRAILPLDGFTVSRSLAKRIRSARFAVTTDHAFARVVTACAESPGREETWISPAIEASYAALHAAGHAHSIEVWRDGDLVGGLYGVSLGRAFFGESMFSLATDASKVALAYLVARLRVGGFVLLDCQFMTPHLASLGAVEIAQEEYLARLYPAVSSVFSAGAEAGAGLGAGAGDSAAGAGDWGALDGLTAARAAGAAAGADDPSSGASTSPGQLILQLLTKTS